MEKTKLTGLYFLGAINALLIAVLLFMVYSGSGRQASSTIDAKSERSVAVALAGRGLYRQAADAYENYLLADLDAEQKANTLYTVGTIYMDKLADCDNAMARFERLKALYPDSKMVNEANKKMVACLEKTGRSLDAQNVLEAATRPEQTQKSAGGTVLARIGDREITDRDLADEISRLPQQFRAQSGDLNFKKEMLNGLIQRELMLASAIRRGLDNDPEVLQELEAARKGILASKVMQMEVIDKIELTPIQVTAYIKDHPDQFVAKDGKPLDPQQVQQLAQRQLYAQEQRRLSMKLFETLSAAQKAEIFADRLQ